MTNKRTIAAAALAMEAVPAAAPVAAATWAVVAAVALP